MPAFPVSVAACVVALVLVVAAVERLRAPGTLSAALSAHRVVAPGAVRVLAAAVPAVEVVLAAALVAGLLLGAPLFPLAGAAALFAAYAAYAWYATRTGRGGPCGCGGAEVPMDHWVTARAVALAALAAFASAGHRAVVHRVDPELVLVLLASATIGALLWHLPAAMHVPVRHREVVR